MNKRHRNNSIPALIEHLDNILIFAEIRLKPQQT